MVDYSKWSNIDADSDEEDSGALITVPGQEGGVSCYRQKELRTDEPWRQEAPPCAPAKPSKGSDPHVSQPSPLSAGNPAPLDGLPAAVAAKAPAEAPALHRAASGDPAG